MFQSYVIGYIGSQAEVKVANGNEFISFRIAHTDRWKDDAGGVHESTQWIDVVMNGRPAVFDYLKRGTLVAVIGPQSVRVYSSAKDRCMKAGVTINARQIELLGGKGDEIPSKLYDMNGVEHDVVKYYNIPAFTRKEQDPEYIPLQSKSGSRFVVDRNGWVQQFVEPESAQNNTGANNNG